MANDKKNKDKFYLATNLHVASMINHVDKEDYYDWNKDKYVLKRNSIFDYMYFGQVVSNNTIGTTNQIERATKTIYTSKIALSNLKVEYTPIDYFSNMNIPNPNGIYNDATLKNATIDFAIISFDISKRETIGIYKNKNDFFQHAINNFIRNPTIFAKPKFGVDNNRNTIINENFFVGGFPYVDKRENDKVGPSFSNVNNIKTNDVVSHKIDLIGNNWKSYYDSSKANINQFKKNIYYQT